MLYLSITYGSVLSKQIKFKVTQEKLEISVSTFLNPEVSGLSSKDYTYICICYKLQVSILKINESQNNT